MTTQSVQVNVELGHRANVRQKVTSDGFTHDWVVFVRGNENNNIQHFVEKVVFNLHQSFLKPKRVVKDPPYEVSESGYASFLMPIEIYFKNIREPRHITFHYDLFLHMEDCPPVSHIRCEKLTFSNPAEDFRMRLLKAGGVGVLGTHHSINQSIVNNNSAKDISPQSTSHNTTSEARLDGDKKTEKKPLTLKEKSSKSKSGPGNGNISAPPKALNDNKIPHNSSQITLPSKFHNTSSPKSNNLNLNSNQPSSMAAPTYIVPSKDKPSAKTPNTSKSSSGKCTDSSPLPSTHQVKSNLLLKSSKNKTSSPSKEKSSVKSDKSASLKLDNHNVTLEKSQKILAEKKLTKSKNVDKLSKDVYHSKSEKEKSNPKSKELHVKKKHHSQIEKDSNKKSSSLPISEENSNRKLSNSKSSHHKSSKTHSSSKSQIIASQEINTSKNSLNTKNNSPQPNSQPSSVALNKERPFKRLSNFTLSPEEVKKRKLPLEQDSSLISRDHKKPKKSKSKHESSKKHKHNSKSAQIQAKNNFSSDFPVSNEPHLEKKIKHVAITNDASQITLNKEKNERNLKTPEINRYDSPKNYKDASKSIKASNSMSLKENQSNSGKSSICDSKKSTPDKRSIDDSSKLFSTQSSNSHVTKKERRKDLIDMEKSNPDPSTSNSSNKISDNIQSILEKDSKYRKSEKHSIKSQNNSLNKEKLNHGPSESSKKIKKNKESLNTLPLKKNQSFAIEKKLEKVEKKSRKSVPNKIDFSVDRKMPDSLSLVNEPKEVVHVTSKSEGIVSSVLSPKYAVSNKSSLTRKKHSSMSSLSSLSESENDSLPPNISHVRSKQSPSELSETDPFEDLEESDNNSLHNFKSTYQASGSINTSSSTKPLKSTSAFISHDLSPETDSKSHSIISCSHLDISSEVISPLSSSSSPGKHQLSPLLGLSPVPEPITMLPPTPGPPTIMVSDNEESEFSVSPSMHFNENVLNENNSTKTSKKRSKKSTNGNNRPTFSGTSKTKHSSVFNDKNNFSHFKEENNLTETENDCSSSDIHEGSDDIYSCSQNAQISDFSTDYLLELLEIQTTLMALKDRRVLRNIVKVIEKHESVNYEVNELTFDFDLCNVSKKTIRKIKYYLKKS